MLAYDFLEYNFLQHCFSILQLVNINSDDEVRNILTKDVNLDILHEIGYSGIPQRETTESAKAIIQ